MAYYVTLAFKKNYFNSILSYITTKEKNKTSEHYFWEMTGPSDHLKQYFFPFLPTGYIYLPLSKVR